MTDKRYSILIIGPTPPPYHGVSIAMDALLNSEIRNYFTIHHVDLADRRGIAHVDKPDFMDVLLFIKQWLSVLYISLKKRPDITYLPISQRTVGFVRDSFFIQIARLCRSKIIIHLHGSNFKFWYNESGTLLKKYASFTMSMVGAGIVLGEAAKENFIDFVCESRIFVVPNGVEVANGKAREKGKNGKKRRILYLGSLTGLKGIHTLLSAIPLVKNKLTEVEFILAGPWASSDDKNKAMNYIQDKGLSEYIHFTGEVDGEKKKNIYESADLFVFPGIQQEGQPLVILEAMSYGLPVLFTDRGCIKETVIDGECGYEIKIGDETDLADKIIKLLMDLDLLQHMGGNCRRRQLERYSLSAHTKRMREVLLKIAGL